MSTYQVDRVKWDAMNIFEQMGNIYSEVGRSFNAKRSGNLANEKLATIRAIDLFDATVKNLVKKKSIRAKEVLRAKEQFLTNMYSEKFNEKAASSLEKYFYEFAVAARLNK